MRVLLVYLALGAVEIITTGAQAQTPCLSQLPEREEVVSLAEEVLSNGTYTVTYSQQYLLTSLVFNCSGAITGWTTVALDGTGGARPEISVWRQNVSDPVEYIKQSGVFMDGCVTQEISPSIHIHQANATALIEFEAGDVLGILVRRDNVFNFAPLLVESENSSQTGYDRERGGPSDSFEINADSTTNLLPLISLDICLRDPSGVDDAYPNCSDIILPSESCPEESTTMPTASSSPPLSTELLLIIVLTSVAVLVVVVVVVVVTVLCCVCTGRKGKMDISPQSLATDIPMNGLHPSLDGEIHHTYETPLREPGPAVTLSLSSNNNHITNPYSNTRATVPNRACSYEEPLVCLSQHESVSGSQDQHTYDYMRSPISNLPPLPTPPPLPSRHTSPHFLSPTTPRFQLAAPPSSIATTTYYHTLERPTPPSSSSPTQPRHTQPHHPVHSSAENSPLPNRHTTDLSNSNTERKPHIEAYASLNPLPPGHTSSPTLHLIEATDESLNVESGVYVPTQHQRNQFMNEPIFDDSVYSTLRKAPNSPGANNWSFFEESEHYWKPASDSASLYRQLFSKKYREINYKQLQITEHLGSGEFGTVCKGFWHTSKGSVEVAVKMVNRQATEQDKVRFLQEAAIMGQFRHPNIVRLYGVVTVHEPVMIVLELMKKGDLKNYVKGLRPVPGELVSPLLQNRLLQFCHDVALGMEYLARKEFVHRDLAARNILLTEDCTCKIADFGMSRDLDDGDYYISQGGKIPFKWTAPEALHYRKYSTASDMWSYGILLWEVWSLGHTPYKDCHTPDETMVRVDSTSRMPPPSGCPRAIYQLMMECWSPKPCSRPTFTSVVQTLSQPTSLLLHWTNEDRQSHPQASCLGAVMEAGKDLFPDLQMMHTKPSS